MCYVYIPFCLELYFPLESCYVQLYLQSSTGVWGPYPSALLKDTWLHEGGQSAVGNLLDLIVETHPAYPQVFLHSIYYRWLYPGMFYYYSLSQNFIWALLTGQKWSWVQRHCSTNSSSWHAPRNIQLDQNRSLKICGASRFDQVILSTYIE